jgi:hypothetical protein
MATAILSQIAKGIAYFLSHMLKGNDEVTDDSRPRSLQNSADTKSKRLNQFTGIGSLWRSFYEEVRSTYNIAPAR